MQQSSAPLPEVRIPVDPLPMNGSRSVQARWSDDGGRLVLGYSVDLGPGPFWHVHGMDFALAAGLAGALWFALLARGIARRPQVAGRTYCARCNYDVSDALASGACPECGANLAPRRASVPGRARRLQAVRAWPRLIVASILAVAGLGHFASRLNGPSTALRTDTWPVAGLDRAVGSWPLWRPLPYVPTVGWRMDAWHVPDEGAPWPGQPEWSVLEERPWVDPAFLVAPDGSRAAWFALGTDSVPHVLKVADFETRSVRGTIVAPSTHGSFRMQGWTDGSTRLTVTVDTLTGVPGADGNATVDSVAKVRVISVDCRHRAMDPVRTVGEASWNQPVRQANVLTHRRLVAAVGDAPGEGSRPWAVAALPENPQRAPEIASIDHFFAGRGGEARSLGTRSCPQPEPGNSWINSQLVHLFHPSITDDGVFEATPALSVRLDDGACAPPRDAVTAWSGDFTGAFAAPHEATLRPVDPTDPAGMRPHRDEVRIGGLAPLVAGYGGSEPQAGVPWPHGFLDWPSVSADGRFAACALAPPPPPGPPGVFPPTNPSGTRYEVWVWRLRTTGAARPAK